MRNALIAIALMLTASTSAIADAKPHRQARKLRVESKWMRTCIAERTGPTGGVSKSEARAICKAEQPDDELEAAKQALTVARLNAKVTKAQDRARKALEACEQAVTDRCVESAAPDGSTDCDTDAGLHAEYELVCLGKAPTGK
jgi:hypothetical protein